MNRLLLIANYDYINTALSLSGIEDEVKTIKDKFELMQYKIEIILNIKINQISRKPINKGKSRVYTGKDGDFTTNLLLFKSLAIMNM